jgi:hypothetical protein
MRHPPRVTKAAQHLFKKFKKATQKAAFTKKEKQMTARAFVAGVCALAEASGPEMTKENWDAVFSILAEKLMEYEL